jgi:alpha-1,2-mannosyltransferase
MARQDISNNRLKAVAVGIGLALTALTIRHWYETFLFGHPLCDNCRPDFPGFYAAAKLVWQTPSMLYDYAHQLAIQSAIDSRIGDSILPFAYPPFTAAVLMPLGWLPFRGSFAAMTFANAILLAFTLKLLIQKLELGKDQTTWLLLSTFCNFGVHSVILQGQTSLIVLSFLTAFMFSLRSGRQSWAGCWAGVIFFKPQLLAVPFIVLLFQRLWRGLAIAATVVGGLCVLSLLLVGPEGISEYLRLLKFYGTTESGFGSYPRDMHNLRALVQYLVPFEYALYLWLGFAIPVAMATMWMNAQTRATQTARLYLWIGNFMAIMLLTPHLYPHDLALLIVPSAVVLKLSSESSTALIHFSLIVLGVLPILPFLLGGRVPPLVPLILLAGFSWCVRFVWQAKRLGEA